ncbi:hypothetical protein ROJ8625_00399 [Roseivivax jejudonensis]|uniref:HAMP domain-containing protein n=1 Tax=Roseivivax jejudonensis TaxID=1529041 RepID=A0A1X6Y8R6_9RHOB|nr:cache and HAMP domain-containing protein [Roseivivax jejudonensis]SLN13387.1 hypothetical protein ROJ8625_00399 [Roseivivax jejudonensis]
MNLSTHRPRLSVVLTFWNALCLGIAVLMVLHFTQQHAHEVSRQAQEDNALRAARAVSLTFSKALDREWESIRAVSEKIETSDYESMRSFVDAVPDASVSVAWAGVADPSGLIVAGSNAVREGEDVSERRWFREGLRGESAGSVFQPSGHEGDGFINLSRPVLDADGAPVGVAVYRIDMAWVDGFIQETAVALDADALVVSRDGSVLASAAKQFDFMPSEAELMALGLGQDRGINADREDGPSFASATISRITSTAVPDMGWSLIVRVPLQGQSATSEHPWNWDVLGFVTAAACILAMLGKVNSVISRPIERLAGCSSALARGELDYPVERAGSFEAEELSQSLAVIQTSLQRHGHFRRNGTMISEGTDARFRLIAAE